MENAKIRESFGYIYKEEKLAPCRSNIIINELVLESIEPFPGYYGGILDTDGRRQTIIESNKTELVRDTSLFIVIKPVATNFGESIIRSIQRIREKLDFSLDAWPGEITINNNTNPCIRLWLNDNERVPEIIKLLQDENINPIKHKVTEPFKSRIKILRFFKLNEVEDGIYHDLIQSRRSYVKIPAELNWETFSELTTVIKNTYNYIDFDVALSAIYNHNGIIDLIRVYDNNATVEKLKLIKDRYTQEIKKNRNQ